MSYKMMWCEEVCKNDESLTNYQIDMAQDPPGKDLLEPDSGDDYDSEESDEFGEELNSGFGRVDDMAKLSLWYIYFL